MNTWSDEVDGMSIINVAVFIARMVFHVLCSELLGLRETMKG